MYTKNRDRAHSRCAMWFEWTRCFNNFFFSAAVSVPLLTMVVTFGWNIMSAMTPSSLVCRLSFSPWFWQRWRKCLHRFSFLDTEKGVLIGSNGYCNTSLHQQDDCTPRMPQASINNWHQMQPNYLLELEMPPIREKCQRQKRKLIAIWPFSESQWILHISIQ